ncbi:type III secretion system chaperone [Comamonas endophytica]|uniref:Type III secretion system chaperone n=1 Tax=Comamonas endophytica TaxID=2949090 RepID=A0ABY6GA57_9BURK|nr:MULTISPECIES: type III secretion system chaperone [unclassified Acidovorax]MCD2511726.1 type III secretion system chaperone [Acidovorax sp. D4N7]UYG51452.1 type III secretion system chaperone [Acidovorax sp. 5MLIR]
MSLDRYHSLLHAYGCGSGAEVTQVMVGTQLIHLHYAADDEDVQDDCLMARTDVLFLPHAPTARVCRTLLQANAFWSGIQGGALGLRGSQVVMLSVSQYLRALNADSLALLLQDMAEDARRWAVVLQMPDSAKPRAPWDPGVLA